jgi:tetratricopeptide (TPR) repeat protein
LFPAFKTFTAGCMLLLLIGCAGVRQSPGPSPDTPPQPPAPETETPIPPEQAPEPDPAPPLPETTPLPPERPSPRALASLELSSQARILIEEGRLNEAIRTLEQAVNLHPGSGESYYYLAEAWRLKGNLSQASEYNRLASIRFQGDSEWMRRIDVQKQRIERMR